MRAAARAPTQARESARATGRCARSRRRRRRGARPGRGAMPGQTARERAPSGLQRHDVLGSGPWHVPSRGPPPADAASRPARRCGVVLKIVLSSFPGEGHAAVGGTRAYPRMSIPSAVAFDTIMVFPDQFRKRPSFPTSSTSSTWPSWSPTCAASSAAPKQRLQPAPAGREAMIDTVTHFRPARSAGAGISIRHVRKLDGQFTAQASSTPTSKTTRSPRSTLARWPIRR